MATTKKPANPDEKPPHRKPTKSLIRDNLTSRELSFIDGYMQHGIGARAAVDAGFAKTSAKVTAHKLLQRPQVIAEIARRREKMEKESGVTAARVLQETFNIFTANVNDLVEFRRRCCRYCYGIGFAYQRTSVERKEDLRAYKKDLARNKRRKPEDRVEMEEFDEQGGIGFDARKGPNDECQQCFGDGIGTAHFKDTRNLSPQALALYAGVKVSKEGTQMLLLDKTAAAEKLFKHFGLFKADNEQKPNALNEIIALIHATDSRLPIKE